MAYVHRPPKPEGSQKFSKEKTIPYPGFEPKTSGLAVGSLNHCTIGSVMFLRMHVVSIDFSTFLIVAVDLFFQVSH
jgi:hypothetical protein